MNEYENIISDFVKVGYEKEKLLDAIVCLLEEGLLESSQTLDINYINTIKLSDKGEFYLKKMIYNFDYLLYIQDRVPMPFKYHIPIETKFGDPQSKTTSEGDWSKRKKSVNNFIKFLRAEEELEQSEYGEQKEILKKIRGGTLIPITDSITERIKKTIGEIDKAYPFIKKRRSLEFINIEPKYFQKEPILDHGNNTRQYHDD